MAVRFELEKVGAIKQAVETRFQQPSPSLFVGPRVNALDLVIAGGPA